MYFKLLKSIHTEKYDIIDAYSKLESWFVVLFSGAKQKISLEKGKKFF
jgi:heptosyltransferase-2